MAQSTYPSLLPPNATPLMRQAEQACAAACDMPVPLPDIWDAYKCPAHLLPWLAWAVHVDVWDDKWSERTQRNVIAASYEIHRRKGSVWSVKEAIKAANYEEPTVMEQLGRRFHDGQTRRNGMCFYGWSLAWAMYRVILNRPIRNDQVKTVLALLNATAPKRSELLTLEYQTCANLHDGLSVRDGAYNRGTANA